MFLLTLKYIFEVSLLFINQQEQTAIALYSKPTGYSQIFSFTSKKTFEEQLKDYEKIINNKMFCLEFNTKEDMTNTKSFMFSQSLTVNL